MASSATGGGAALICDWHGSTKRLLPRSPGRRVSVVVAFGPPAGAESTREASLQGGHDVARAGHLEGAPRREVVAQHVDDEHGGASPLEPSQIGSGEWLSAVDGKPVRGIQYKLQPFMVSCADAYRKIVGKRGNLPGADTPLS